MRLTLRTLLAFLDNTLEPADAELLRQKLADSGFATQLVQRIRANLVDATLPAPPPGAVGPIRDANVIGEYLDSTLPHEQVAEIERACLESDASLAEAAACHQILTMVLGQPAEVPAALRQRIYELPDQEAERIAATSQRFSSLRIEPDQAANPSIAELPTADSPAVAGSLGDSFSTKLPPPVSSDLPASESTLRPGRQVSPVGPNDSGVSDAPTRLRESGVLDRSELGQARLGDPVSSGARVRLGDAGLYGGSIRPSRITPWLVSLAVAGVLLFVVTQIFRPLLNGPTASNDSRTLEDDPVLLEPQPSEMDETPGETPEKSTELGKSVAAEPKSGATDPEPELANGDRAVAPTEVAPSDAPEPQKQPATETKPAETKPAETDAAKPDPNSVAMATPESTDTKKPTAAPEPPPKSDAIEADNELSEDLVATMDAENAIVVTMQQDGQYTKLGADAQIGLGTPLVCAPKFRVDMVPVAQDSSDRDSSDAGQAEDVRITLIGPTGVAWLPAGEDGNGLAVSFGRLLITSKKPDANIILKLGEQMLELQFPDEESVVAAIVRHTRRPGSDPTDPEEGIELAAVMSVQGTVEILAKGSSEETISTGQMWSRREASEAKIVDAETPEWVDPLPSGASTLDDYARDGLLALVNGDDPIELALREATHFRRSEVAALAAQTLLFLGQGDVYFGGDGILSEPKQRPFWSEHYQALVAVMDQGAGPAERLRDAIKKMDLANADALFRLLVGYSEKQLVEGGDAELVNLLDSDSMAVRVLTLENLQSITGVTLTYKPEQTIAVRRAPSIKKWAARQQKGEIRRED